MGDTAIRDRLQGVLDRCKNAKNRKHYLLKEHLKIEDELLVSTGLAIGVYWVIEDNKIRITALMQQHRADDWMIPEVKPKSCSR
jgi:hypothetical protein